LTHEKVFVFIPELVTDFELFKLMQNHASISRAEFGVFCLLLTKYTNVQVNIFSFAAILCTDKPAPVFLHTRPVLI